MATPEPTYRRTRTRQPYIYVVGPVDVPGSKQTVMDVHADLRDNAPYLPDHLVGMGKAIWQSIAGKDAGEEPEGFTIRLVRITTTDYNSLVAHANAQATKGIDTSGFRARGPIFVRYLRKAVRTPGDPDAWDTTPWEEQRTDLNFGEARLPAPDPFAVRREPKRTGAYDGQHRLN
jgi:hypothetical protein